MDVSRINETLKNAIDEMDLDRRLNEAVDQAERGFKRAVELAGEYAHEHRDDYERVMDKISGAVRERTEGRYDEQVDKVRSTLDTGMARLAERREDPTD